MPIQIIPGANESPDGFFYLKGNATTDGSWRALVDTAGAMSFQFRQAGAWVNKGSLPQGGGTYRKILRDGDDLVPLLDATELRQRLNISDQGAMDGRSPTLAIVNDYLAWQYPGDASWTKLIAIADLMPEPVKGDDGVTPVLRAAGNELQASYDAGQTWNNVFNLQALKPADGTDGVDGETPQLRTTSGVLQGSYDGVTWFDMFDLTSLRATDGRSAIMRISDGQVQWQLQGDGSWNNLFSVPRDGENGPANTLKIGTVSTGTAAVSITGDSPNQTLNFTLPAATNGTNGISYTPQSPVPRTVSVGTAYQHTDTTKPYKVVVNARATSQVTLLALNQIDRVELRIGPTAASVALNGSGGFSMGVWETGIAGISVTVGTSLQDGGQISADVPVGWYFSVNRQQGTAATIVSCFTQSLTP